MASSSDVNRRLVKLTYAWDGLRNAALGRGVVPPKGVPVAFANAIGDEAEQFHQWRDELTPAAILLAAPFAVSGEIETWEKRYNERAAQLRAYTSGPADIVVDEAPSPADLVPSVGKGVFTLLLGLGIVYIVVNRH